MIPTKDNDVISCQIYAVYNRNKKLLALLAMLCLVEAVTTLLVEGLAKPHGELLKHRLFHLKSYWDFQPLHVLSTN
jgi:hypothetical protein